MINESNSSIIFGRNAVSSFLNSDGKVDTVYFSDENPQNAYLAALAKQAGATVKQIHPTKMKMLCGSERHQGVAAAVAQIEYASLDSVFEKAAERGEDFFAVIADDINDPHNLGAIIRSAECAGVHGVIIPMRGGVAVTPTVYMTSAGAAAHIAVVRVNNLANVIRELKQRNVFVYSADMDGQPAVKTNLTGPICLVVGSEGKGVSRLVKELCDGCVSFPIRGKTNSLNASVAAGVAIYEVVRQRDASISNGGADGRQQR